MTRSELKAQTGPNPSPLNRLVTSVRAAATGHDLTLYRRARLAKGIGAGGLVMPVTRDAAREASRSALFGRGNRRWYLRSA